MVSVTISGGIQPELAMQKPPPKLMENIWTFIGAVLIVGPFALPLLWRNPRYSRLTKVSWSFLVIALTVLLLWGSTQITASLIELTQP